MPWELTGNSGINSAANFVGTTDNQPLVIKVNGLERMRITPADGKVGIGTGEPHTPLHVFGRISTGANMASAGAVTFFPPDGFAWFHIDNGPGGGRPIGRLRISGGENPGDHEYINVLQNGNVGVGTSEPQAYLHVVSSAGWQNPQMEVTQTSPGGYARVRLTSHMVDPDNTSNPITYLWDIAAGRDELNLYTQYPMGATVASSNVMTLKASGMVGIGTGTPRSKLDVNGTATVNVLEITGGSDIAEPFALDGDEEPEPGTVLVIDDRLPGRLRVSDRAYDRKVAGIVSGAGGMNPGLTLRQAEMTERRPSVALAGRVYCKAEAASSPIEPGDLLTTSGVPGHAMKATDGECSRGAVLGKAMTPLGAGTGLVLALISLQ